MRCGFSPADLKHISNTSLAITADEDDLIPKQHLQGYAENLPDLYHAEPEGDHWSVIKNPKLPKTIDHFLDNIGR